MRGQTRTDGQTTTINTLSPSQGVGV